MKLPPCESRLLRLGPKGEIISPMGIGANVAELIRLPRGARPTTWLATCRKAGRASAPTPAGGWLVAIPDEEGYAAVAADPPEARSEPDVWALLARLLARRSAPADVASRLRDSEMRLSFALRSLQAGIFDWSLRDGKVTYIPWQATALLPQTFETHASTWDAQVHPDDQEAGREQTAAVMSGKSESFRMVVRQRVRSHTDYRRVESSGRVVERDARGRPSRIVGTFVDVTERVEFERRLRDTEDALARATEYAMLGELASGVAHEINQPLAALLAYLSVAGKRMSPIKDAALKDAVTEATRMAERLGDTVSRVRRLVRRTPPAPVPYDLNAAAEQALELTRRTVGDTTLLFRLEPGTDRVLSRLRGDAIQIGQLVANLARNAADACRSAGGRRVVVRTAREGREAVLTVTDDGPGIPPDTAARIFDPFFTTKANSTGLGLPLCRSIAEAHGGTLHLTVPAKGRCTFTLRLPLRPTGQNKT